MINENFVYLASLLAFLGSAAYAYDTLRGKTKPNRITWFLWALAPLIAFAAEVYDGVGIASLMTFMMGFGPMIVFTSSFLNKKAYWEISKIDIVCGALSFLGIILWLLTRTGAIAILFSIVADGLAALPTIRKSIKAPETESYNVFLFSTISAAITMLTLKEWTFSHYAFPLYIFLLCGFLFIVIFRKQGFRLIKK